MNSVRGMDVGEAMQIQVDQENLPAGAHNVEESMKPDSNAKIEGTVTEMDISGSPADGDNEAEIVNVDESMQAEEVDRIEDSAPGSATEREEIVIDADENVRADAGRENSIGRGATQEAIEETAVEEKKSNECGAVNGPGAEEKKDVESDLVRKSLEEPKISTEPGAVVGVVEEKLRSTEGEICALDGDVHMTEVRSSGSAEGVKKQNNVVLRREQRSCNCRGVPQGLEPDSVRMWAQHLSCCPAQDQGILTMTERERENFNAKLDAPDYQLLLRLYARFRSQKKGEASRDAYEMAMRKFRELSLNRPEESSESEEERRPVKEENVKVERRGNKAVAMEVDNKESMKIEVKQGGHDARFKQPQQPRVETEVPVTRKLSQPTLSSYAARVQNQAQRIPTTRLQPLQSVKEDANKEEGPRPLVTIEDIANSLALYVLFMKKPEEWPSLLDRLTEQMRLEEEPKMQEKPSDHPEEWPKEGYSWSDADLVRYQLMQTEEVDKLIQKQGPFRIEVGEFGIHACFHFTAVNTANTGSNFCLQLITFDVNGWKKELYTAKGKSELTFVELGERITKLRYGSIIMLGGQFTQQLMKDFKAYVQPYLYTCGFIPGNFVDLAVGHRVALYGMKGARAHTCQVQARPLGCYIYRKPCDISSIMDGLLGNREGLCPSCSTHRGCGVRRGIKDENIIIPEGEITWEHMFEQMEKVGFPHSTSRQNVMCKDKSFLECFCFGIVNCYSVGPVVSVMTHRMPQLARLVIEKLKRDKPDRDLATGPHPFTIIQVNRSVFCKMHVDGNNAGPSYICTFGNFTGGDVWIYDGHGPVSQTVEEPLRGYPSLKVGDVIKGTCHDARNKFVYFDGRVPHRTMPFEGRRYAFVYFVHNCTGRLKNQEILETLKNFGFRVPDPKHANLKKVTDDDIRNFDENPDLIEEDLKEKEDDAECSAKEEAGCMQKNEEVVRRKQEEKKKGTGQKEEEGRVEEEKKHEAEEEEEGDDDRPSKKMKTENKEEDDDERKLREEIARRTAEIAEMMKLLQQKAKK